MKRKILLLLMLLIPTGVYANTIESNFIYEGYKVKVTKESGIESDCFDKYAFIGEEPKNCDNKHFNYNDEIIVYSDYIDIHEYNLSGDGFNKPSNAFDRLIVYRETQPDKLYKINTSDVAVVEEYKVDSSLIGDEISFYTMLKTDLRSGPGLGYSIIDTIPANTNISGFKYNRPTTNNKYSTEDQMNYLNIWNYVEYNGKKGFVYYYDYLRYNMAYGTMIETNKNLKNITILDENNKEKVINVTGYLLLSPDLDGAHYVYFVKNNDGTFKTIRDEDIYMKINDLKYVVSENTTINGIEVKKGEYLTIYQKDIHQKDDKYIASSYKINIDGRIIEHDLLDDNRIGKIMDNKGNVLSIYDDDDEEDIIQNPEVIAPQPENTENKNTVIYLVACVVSLAVILCVVLFLIIKRKSLQKNEDTNVTNEKKDK